jgi:hypothetical protein
MQFILSEINDHHIRYCEHVSQVQPSPMNSPNAAACDIYLEQTELNVSARQRHGSHFPACEIISFGLA